MAATSLRSWIPACAGMTPAPPGAERSRWIAWGFLIAIALPLRCGIAGENSKIDLRCGEFYFRIGGRPSFILGRNPTGWKVEQFGPLFEWAAGSGETLMRIHLTNGMPANAPPGEVDEDWAQRWERVFDMAAASGLRVLPVFGVWADWNDGGRGEPWHSWHKNRYNASLGGPAKSPADLFRDTECRRLWLQWLRKMVGRWQGRAHILGWEVFSELDLVTGSTEDAAVGFVAEAAKVVRAADAQGRPVTASLSGIGEWPRLFASNALNFLQVHPYANHPRFKGDLAGMIVETVRARRKRYGKPVLIGECGLDSGSPPGTLTVSSRAHIGIGHAIWASVVSGAMAGRMLWWEDGYDLYSKLDLRTKYKNASAPVATFVKGVDFTGFEPVDVKTSPEINGAAIGNNRVVLGWFRDVECAPPNWPERPVAGQRVVLPALGRSGNGNISFHDTTTGQIIAKQAVRADEGKIAIILPMFQDSIAFKLAVPETER
ncbi:MAG: hypothetical protein AB1696_27755 [Planctomycetota bacterium]